MSATSYKANVITAELKDRLARRFTTVSDVQFDTDGAPFLTCTQGTLAAGQQVALVKVIAEQPLGVDGLGLTPRAFSPHRMQVVLETSTIANVALMTEVNKLFLLGEVTHFGVKTEIYLRANASAVVIGDITSGNLKASWDPDLKWRSMSSI